MSLPESISRLNVLPAPLYLLFQRVADDLNTEFNAMGLANWTVCPSCMVDDFCHVEGCHLAPVEAQR